MPNYTKNYNLIKPNKTENYDIEDVTNKNMDIIDEELFGKVDKVPGKGLSTNDFTNEYKNKLDRLENYDDEELKNKLNEQAQKNKLQEKELEELQVQLTNLQTENTQLKNQIPTGTAEGETIYLSDSSDLEAKIIVKGNSKQEGTPTPENKVDVETVGSNVNLFDKESISENKAINGYYSNPSYGQLVDSSLSNTTDYMPIQKDKSYIFHFDYDTLGSSNNRAYCFYNEQKEVISSVKDTLYNLSNKELKFTATQNGFVRITYDKNCKDIKFEKGTKATPYSKYGQGSVEIEVLNKNLLDINNLLNGYVTISTSSIAWAPTTNERTAIIDANKYKGLTLTVSSDGNRSNLSYLDSDNPQRYDTGYLIKNNGSLSTCTFTIPEQPEHPYIAIQLNFGADYIPTWCQLEVGEKATEKVEHQFQTKILPIQEEMLEDDYIEDVEYHTWGKIVLDGSENFSYISGNSDTGSINRFILVVSPVQKYNNDNVSINAISNYFNGVPWSNSWLKDNSITTSSTDIRFATNKYTNVDDFKEWLSNMNEAGNPVVVYYKLAIPKSLPLTEEQRNILDKKTYTYKNITNINTNSIAILDVTYKKDLETMINNIASSVTNSVTTNEEV